MTALMATTCLILIAIIVVQIGKVTELASKIRGEEEVEEQTNRRHGNYSLLFMVLFLVGSVASAWYYKDSMLWYGPNESASVHGSSLDSIFNITLFFTGIVFIITQVLLFYFAWKYRGQRGRKALYMPHDNRLEVVWTVIPAIVMTFLVVGGLDAWNEVMADIDPGEEFIEIEGTGYQFAWHLRYPGADGKLGARDYKMISATNPLGQVWTDPKNVDDIHPSEIYLPVGKKVRVRITARDVLHNFYLPHFRVKMDAVPGMPTYFVFTPKTTTEEYRQKLGALDLNGQPKYPEWHERVDPNDPESPKRYEAFDFELACAELCGKGHYAMRRVVKIVSEGEYQDWLSKQPSYYLSTIRGTEDDPNKDVLFEPEIQQRRQEFDDNLEKALSSEDPAAKTLELNYVNFETNSAELTKLSAYQLDNLASALNKYPAMAIEISGHTDNTGEPDYNQQLSEQRAQKVKSYLADKGIAESRLAAVGYGASRPMADNNTEEGRDQNRRTEFRITAQ
ncbi:MAG: OmpA family protein [Lewinellaceae bacterium]|nr:OmpA family protein [Phaeodactylibacter sp.]MCB9038965.1 OmpA family protein [Lewinellaceae bacterium]